jgi:thiol-disulfide isomerase/thioredoxin
MARVRAPELDGAGGWVNSDPLTLAELRGQVVLLDFWTLACANCLRVAEDLRVLERRFAGALVVIGVHSPKFPHEHDHAAVRMAVARHRVEHPVFDDPDGTTWDAYAVRAWPTLVLIDQQGRVVTTVAGEGHGERLGREIEALVVEGDATGEQRHEAVAVTPEAHGTGELAFPGKVCADATGMRLAIAYTGHDRVLVTTLDGEVLHELGGLYQPQGVRFDGDDGEALLVCEQAADRVWRIRLRDGERELLTDRLASPWDVVRWRGHVVIAEAARHRLWAIDDDEPQVVAGTGGENIVDGPGLEALLAQPSGLAVTADGDLAFVDAESSSLRILTLEGTVRTLAGEGLFVSGDADGDAHTARLQHPLGVAAGPDSGLYVADAFNGLLRVWRGTHLWTVPVDGFDEPGGLDVLPDGRVVVADTNNHRVVLVDPVGATAEAIDVGRPASTDDPAAAPTVAGTVVAEEGGVLEAVLDVDLEGDELDAMGGPPVRVIATATDPGLLGAETAWALDALPARVEVPLGSGSGRITLELRAATCAGDVCRLRRAQRAYDVILAPG